MLDLLSLLAGVALLSATALLVVAVARPRGLATTLTALPVAAFGTVVLAAEAVSLLGALDRAGLLAAQVVLLAAAALAWHLGGRPQPWRELRAGEAAAAARAAARRHPLVAGLCAAAGISMAIQLAVGLVGAPTNWDSMTYHLSRAAYWLQEGAALRFDGGSLRQLASLPNAELATSWTMAVSGSDRFVEVVQWTALAACVPAIIGLARLLGFGRAESAAAAALFVVLPGPVLQSATTQNDLVVAACVLAAALLGARGLREGHVGTLILAGAALGLGLGTKGTVLFALPAIAIIVGATAWRARPSRRTFTAAASSALVGFALFGAFQYVQNLVDTGGPFGGQVELVGGRELFGASGNAARVLWNFVDSPGVPLPLADRVFEQTVARVVPPTGAAVSEMRVGTHVDEDSIAGGLVGWLVLWPLVLAILLWPGVRLERRAQAAAALSLALAIALRIAATPYNGRILLPTLALGAPLLALVARRRWSLAVTGALALVSLVPCLLISASHVLWPGREQPFFEKDRIAQMTVLRPDQEPLLRHVERRFASNAPLLFVGGEDSWDYPYFGSRRTRRVVRADTADVPRGGGGVLCKWLLGRVASDHVAGVLIVGATGAMPVPPASTRPVQPSPGDYVLRASDVRRGCA